MVSKKEIVVTGIIAIRDNVPNTNKIIFPYETLGNLPEKLPVYKQPFRHQNEVPIGEAKLIKEGANVSAVITIQTEKEAEALKALMEAKSSVYFTMSGEGKFEEDDNGIKTVKEYKYLHIGMSDNNADERIKPIELFYQKDEDNSE